MRSDVNDNAINLSHDGINMKCISSYGAIDIQSEIVKNTI